MSAVDGLDGVAARPPRLLHCIAIGGVSVAAFRVQQGSHRIKHKHCLAVPLAGIQQPFAAAVHVASSTVAFALAAGRLAVHLHVGHAPAACVRMLIDVVWLCHNHNDGAQLPADTMFLPAGI